MAACTQTVGPKQRRYDRPPNCRPTVQDWTQHTRQAGPDGGCKAHVTNWDQHVQQYTASALSWQDRCQADSSWRRQMRILAQEYVRRVAQHVWLAKGTAPKVWRMLLFPNYKALSGRIGVGFHESIVTSDAATMPPWIGIVPKARILTNVR